MFSLKKRIIISVMTIAMLPAMAFAAPKSPEELAATYKTLFDAKNCDGLMALWDNTGTAGPSDLLRKGVCDFTLTIASIKATPADAAMTAPKTMPNGKTYGWNLPIVQQLEITYGGQGMGGARFFIGKKGDEYYLSTRVEQK